jgi:glycosyltransferase involved in cell wall biosynthesis
MAEEYKEVYEKYFKEKFIVIMNGFDPEDIEVVEPAHFSLFTILYTGKYRTSIGFRNPTPFFRALKILKERGLVFHFIHVGCIEDEVVELAQQAGVQDCVEFVGAYSYHEALAYAKGADIILLRGGGQKIEQTTKIFDYIGCKKPILALDDSDGEIARIIRKIPRAYLVGRSNFQAIAGALEKLYLDRYESNNELDKNVVENYHRRHLTERLAALLDRVLNDNGKVSDIR